jgi:hypothetical protein
MDRLPRRPTAQEDGRTAAPRCHLPTPAVRRPIMDSTQALAWSKLRSKVAERRGLRIRQRESRNSSAEPGRPRRAHAAAASAAATSAAATSATSESSATSEACGAASAASATSGAAATMAAAATAAATPGQLQIPGILLVEDVESGQADVRHLLFAKKDLMIASIASRLCICRRCSCGGRAARQGQ